MRSMVEGALIVTAGSPVNMHTADDILEFWFVECTKEQWFGGGPDFDAALAARFIDTHAAVAAGEAWTWRSTPRGRLAEVIVLDQFSRQIHRGTARAFASDPMALALAQEAVYAGLDQQLTPMPERMFLYMPFMHSESLVVHEEAVRLFTTLGSEDVLNYEIAHRDLLRRFGRYPRRNEPLGRVSTPEEVEYCASEEGKW
ncbi:DUF924 domain-containing protein [Devosia sp. ZB163]|uniref:DUF924 family protein n=1 Tax=Devosia sp. ZB163 TaxID=3025938 RepID=UPI002361019F|nr:DUF924 family protein [Devosia sp. ZB163]MDC9823418.1 DUF924 domain-containing protein [Devosia sp. ZB163]